nr:hypothetical protein [Kibdelosporangium sp. MJ126-NF4]CEL17475.1 hypothetical protein [Kibdelosporangium sp. MJ126-NF4]CTQ91298.1 hypothetical protein [Kibdelosporangium sp. MJ126-NF4]
MIAEQMAGQLDIHVGPPRFRFHELVKLVGRNWRPEVDLVEERRAVFGRALNVWTLLADAARGIRRRQGAREAARVSAAERAGIRTCQVV